MNIYSKIGKDWEHTKQKYDELSEAFERRDDFIRWLLEVKLESNFSLREVWDEFEEFEKSEK